ncbi:MAG: SDR family oxidoreductase [Alphaproteobacteria bacterium]|nr:SDR family oxidoreductase [Alphaproteobacteria bacterium]
MSENSRIAVVTGGGTGIGQAVALALQADGYNVVIAGRHRAKLEDTIKLAKPGAGEFRAVPTDIADPLAVKALFHAVDQAYGRLDVLFNNAGIGAPVKPMEELTAEEWRKVVSINLSGVFYCCQEAIKLMKAQDPQGGRIINNGSISAHSPRPMTAPYTATKHAITGLTKSIALDGRPFNIACSQVDIGNAATEMTEPFVTGVMQADGHKRPEPRMDVDHVAQAVLFMANLPLESNVLNMTIKATNMPFEGRG